MPVKKKKAVIPEVQNLLKRTAALGISLRGIAEKTGVSHTMFVRWRSGETRPSIAHYLTWLRTIEKLEKVK